MTGEVEEDEKEEGRRWQGLVAAGCLFIDEEGACILMEMVGGTVVSSMAVCVCVRDV